MTSKIEDWLLFLKDPSPKVLEELAMKDPIFAEAKETLYFVSQDPAERRAYEARMKALRDKNTELVVAMAEGEAKGKAEGEAKGRIEGEAKKAQDMAKNLKKAGVLIETIVQASGLSVDEIEKL
ncbi:MAG: PD-(D/E)XK nuclease family transposase [Silvanigrellaceae bacterium]|nr:PD-(D/E)XK nuclease family transposase [Silvanigrellaceae bacterium]